MPHWKPFPPMTEFEEYLRDCQARVERALEARLPSVDIPPQKLHAAMRYATLGAGKRIRPVLVYATGRCIGIAPERLDAPACAVELIHAYSLVHDDLPAMDNDDLRRGRPTCHRAFGEATAILVGDALQTLAFYTLSRDPALGVPAEVRLQMIEQLALASGSRGMVGGQALDLAAVGHELDLVELQNLHIHKTGALIRASVRLGALCDVVANAETLRKLEHYAGCIGLAFQIKDDILDVEGETAVLGKTRGKDQIAAKPTYPALLGLAGARAKAEELHREAVCSLDGLGDAAMSLRCLADYIIGRRF
jgi:geranylgeranyl pyrophosphate synthase